MRKKIRLTGRREIPKSSFAVQAVHTGEKGMLALVRHNDKVFRSYPDSARLKLRLFENKCSETVDFGTIKKPELTRQLNFQDFVAPSCQLRIMSTEAETFGLVLGSTDKWTLHTQSLEGDKSSTGILHFLPKSDVSPQIWKLDIRDDDYPIVYLNSKIPDSAIWVRNDPVFISVALPAIIKSVFREILNRFENKDYQWIQDWLKWASSLIPGTEPPFQEDPHVKEDWIERLADTFCRSHQIEERMIASLDHEEETHAV